MGRSPGIGERERATVSVARCCYARERSGSREAYVLYVGKGSARADGIICECGEAALPDDPTLFCKETLVGESAI